VRVGVAALKTARRRAAYNATVLDRAAVLHGVVDARE
jgi:hypothetical protein